MDSMLINRDGKQFGPYTFDEVKSYVAAGNILDTDFAWTEGMTGWSTVTEIIQNAERRTTPDQSMKPVKYCPFCGEEILVIAKKCKHCGSDLESEVLGGASSKPTTDYGMFLLAIPVVATMLIWFWVSDMNLLQSPGSTMALIMIATILGTAIVAAMEASKVGMKSDREKGTYSPTAWFFIISLLWIIGYPVYLFKRKHYGLANRLVAGILVAVVFLGSWIIMSSAIEAKKKEIRGNLEQFQNQLNSLGR